jgi:ABC-type sugar transport system ATPase subunit
MGELPAAPEIAGPAGVSPPPVLTFRSVSKRYGAVRALQDVNAEIHRGRVVALCGENGAGKSTFAAVAAGLIRPDEGELLLDGKVVTFGSARDAQQAGVRLIPQELVLCPNLTAAENIGIGKLPARAGIVDMGAARRVARERLGRLGSQLDPDASVSTLSVAEQASVQIARAIAPGVRVLVVDEPTAPMSNAEADRFMTMIKNLADEGIAIVYVSHRLGEVVRLADEVLVLRDGERVAGWSRGAVDRAAIVRAMVGDRDMSVVHRRGAARGAPVLVAEGLARGRVRDASITLHEGEILAVYGIAGSGREDLALALAGAARRQAGTVCVRGRPIAHLRDAISAGVGLVPAERRSQGLIPERSVRENVTLAMLSQLSRATVIRRAKELRTANHWIARLAIATSSPDKPVRQLSGGSQQKVLLARWLAAGSRVLILDEPTRGVDIATKAEIYRLLRGLADEGGAVLAITSDVEEVIALADRTLVMRDGNIVRELTDTTEAEVAEAALVADPAVMTSSSDRSPGGTP